MAFKSLLILVATAAFVAAVPATSDALCSHGRRAKSATVCLSTPLRDDLLVIDLSFQCCKWFDVLDDIQTNL